MLKVAFITSGRGSSLKLLAQACEAEFIGAKLVQVVADRPCEAIDVAKQFQIPAVQFEFTRSASSDQISDHIADILDEAKPDLIFLSYNRIISKKIIDKFPGAIVNMHPSLLPAYKGFGAIDQSFKRAIFCGVTLHICTENVDGGPLIVQTVIPFEPNLTIEDLRHRLFVAQAKQLLQLTQWVAEGRLANVDNRAIISGAVYGGGLTNPRLELDFETFPPLKDLQ